LLQVKPLSVGLVLLFTGAAVAAAWLAHQVLLLAFLGLLIGVVFSFPVDWLAKVMPRGLAVILVILALAGGTAGLGAMVVPTLVRQAEELRESAPRALREARRWLRTQQGEESARKTEEQAKQTAGKAAEGALKAALGLVSSATIIVLVIALGAFLVHEPDSYRRGVRHLIPRATKSASTRPGVAPHDLCAAGSAASSSR
jgi:predicted PurR-regulated permease PerM